MKEQGEHILVHCSSVFEYYPLHQKHDSYPVRSIRNATEAAWKVHAVLLKQTNKKSLPCN